MKRFVIAAIVIAACAWVRSTPAAGAAPSGADGGTSAPLRVSLMGIGVEVHPGYVRVSEVLAIENPSNATFVGDVTFGVPEAARYITFQEGLVRPRVDGPRIVDRLTVRPGAYRVAIAYSIAGSGDLDLSRPAPLPIDRLMVLATGPVQIHSSQLEPLPPVVDDGRTVVRAAGRAIAPGHLALRLAGVPAARRWPAPAAAGSLAALLAAGLIWAAVSHDRKRRG